MKANPRTVLTGVYYIDGDEAFVPGVWCRNNLKPFLKIFDEHLRNQGVKKYGSISTRSPEVYERFMGMKRKYCVFEKEL